MKSHFVSQDSWSTTCFHEFSGFLPIFLSRKRFVKACRELDNVLQISSNQSSGLVFLWTQKCLSFLVGTLALRRTSSHKIHGQPHVFTNFPVFYQYFSVEKKIMKTCRELDNVHTSIIEWSEQWFGVSLNSSVPFISCRYFGITSHFVSQDSWSTRSWHRHKQQWKRRGYGRHK